MHPDPYESAFWQWHEDNLDLINEALNRMFQADWVRTGRDLADLYPERTGNEPEYLMTDEALKIVATLHDAVKHLVDTPKIGMIEKQKEKIVFNIVEKFPGAGFILYPSEKPKEHDKIVFKIEDDGSIEVYIVDPKNPLSEDDIEGVKDIVADFYGGRRLRVNSMLRDKFWECYVPRSMEGKG